MPITQIGEQQITIPVITSALTVIRSDGRHELEIALNSELGCAEGGSTKITIGSNS